MARAAWAQGRADEARAWIARGTAAAQEPDWSDLDPEGRAFAYGQGDWTRLVSTYAETGELLHPRYERRERALSDLPEVPAQYEAPAPFVSAAESPDAFMAPLPDDPGYYDDALAGPLPDVAPQAAPRRAIGRRAGGLGKKPAKV
jgi:HemY protein